MKTWKDKFNRRTITMANEERTMEVIQREYNAVCMQLGHHEYTAEQARRQIIAKLAELNQEGAALKAKLDAEAKEAEEAKKDLFAPEESAAAVASEAVVGGEVGNG
jgi:predicted  nucleic acid-binding Zn-ribbon protein